MVGFEPTICFRIRVLQTRSLSHSDTCSVAEVGFEPTRAFLPSEFSYHIRFCTNHLLEML